MSDEPISSSISVLTELSWSIKRKWAATVVVSTFSFISTVSSTMIAPAGEQLAKDLKIESEVFVALTTSVFVLAYGEFRAWTTHTLLI